MMDGDGGSGRAQWMMSMGLVLVALGVVAALGAAFATATTPDFDADRANAPQYRWSLTLEPLALPLVVAGLALMMGARWGGLRS
jgi:hypothetical protein